MNDYKLYKVYHLGNAHCYHLHVARSPEEALRRCFGHTNATLSEEQRDKSCRAEEVKIDGYTIKIEKERSKDIANETI